MKSKKKIDLKEHVLLFENSGGINEKGYSEKLKELYDACVNKLKSYDPEDYMANIVERKRKVSYILKFKSLPTEIFPSFPLGVEILVTFLVVNPAESHKNKTFLRGFMEVSEGRDFHITIETNLNKKVKELLTDVEILEAILSHELVHVFKYLRGEYQKKVEDFLSNRGASEVDMKKYMSDGGEIDAFITQMNVQLKQIIEKEPTITFGKAIRKNKSYIAYMEGLNKAFKKHDDIFSIETSGPFKKIKTYVLRKLAHYWAKELKGIIK
jgi:hypothetical protein